MSGLGHSVIVEVVINLGLLEAGILFMSFPIHPSVSTPRSRGPEETKKPGDQDSVQNYAKSLMMVQK